jgi:hypothetical protein
MTSALLVLPRSMPRSEKETRVESVLDMLVSGAAWALCGSLLLCTAACFRVGGGHLYATCSACGVVRC